AGNQTTTLGRTVTVDNTAPTSVIQCNNANCGNGFHAAPLSVTLSATDNVGGTGVKEIRYTLDGDDPTPSTGTVYTGPITLTQTTTIRWAAIDNATNIETVNTKTIQVTGPPGTSVTSPNDGDWVGGTIMLTASASSPAGIDHVDFLVDGSVLTT